VHVRCDAQGGAGDLVVPEGNGDGDEDGEKRVKWATAMVGKQANAV
jgi:hypothetical protein